MWSSSLSQRRSKGGGLNLFGGVPCRDQRAQLYLTAVSMSKISLSRRVRTNVDMWLISLEDGCEPSVMGAVSTEDLLYGVDALLLPYGNSRRPYERCYPPCETRHL